MTTNISYSINARSGNRRSQQRIEDGRPLNASQQYTNNVVASYLNGSECSTHTNNIYVPFKVPCIIPTWYLKCSITETKLCVQNGKEMRKNKVLTQICVMALLFPTALCCHVRRKNDRERKKGKRQDNRCLSGRGAVSPVPEEWRAHASVWTRSDGIRHDVPRKTQETARGHEGASLHTSVSVCSSSVMMWKMKITQLEEPGTSGNVGEPNSRKNPEDILINNAIFTTTPGQTGPLQLFVPLLHPPQDSPRLKYNLHIFTRWLLSLSHEKRNK